MLSLVAQAPPAVRLFALAMFVTSCASPFEANHRLLRVGELEAPASLRPGVPAVVSFRALDACGTPPVPTVQRAQGEIIIALWVRKRPAGADAPCLEEEAPLQTVTLSALASEQLVWVRVRQPDGDDQARLVQVRAGAL